MRSRLPRHKGDGWPSCFYPPPLAAVKRPPFRAGVSRKHSVLMSKRACRGTLSPMPPTGGTFRQGCRKVFCAKIGFGEIIKPDLIWILHTFNSHMRYRKSGSATLPNPIFYLLLYFPCLGKKILHRSVLIIPQTLHDAVQEPVRTQQRHDHPPKTGEVACSRP